MVRPAASWENKRIALAFAHMVTSPAPFSGPARQSVCRTGRFSVYDALSACCPMSVINNDPYDGKYGLRAIEFYKVVESNGFVKVRHQRPRGKSELSSSSGSWEACTEEVRYVYAGRRWRDPSSEEDMQSLRGAWEELAGSSTIFATQCPWERVVRVCEEYRRGWAEYQAGLLRPLPGLTRRPGEEAKGGGKRRRLDEAGRSSPGSSTPEEAAGSRWEAGEEDLEEDGWHGDVLDSSPDPQMDGGEVPQWKEPANAGDFAWSSATTGDMSLPSSEEFLQGAILTSVWETEGTLGVGDDEHSKVELHGRWARRGDRDCEGGESESRELQDSLERWMEGGIKVEDIVSCFLSMDEIM
ncbi:hypothetical protein GUITHDRAFT_101413 [Guillardia theta CCMP2712]|uniref:Uncharacterized protein n=1 Tax=Guillardia theta (strain CCMP2712) TaxID=905079 RepID=L1JWK9_GUITC|nr:hypothetical protein GUITHDRAFT_101413 [Guillardia theta CCMP2712]EKX52961.1 hypothetical protein GUITHDRAFT_101413 [Guillardia theta CCMP2712]|eukprot:XP_005839941.1 hypothetical protein GUITHDRAFT_101413 [Guillardia theta CCMP2712]